LYIYYLVYHLRQTFASFSPSTVHPPPPPSFLYPSFINISNFIFSFHLLLLLLPLLSLSFLYKYFKFYFLLPPSPPSFFILPLYFKFPLCFCLMYYTAYKRLLYYCYCITTSIPLLNCYAKTTNRLNEYLKCIDTKRLLCWNTSKKVYFYCNTAKKTIFFIMLQNDYLYWAASMLDSLRLTLRRMSSSISCSSRNLKIYKTIITIKRKLVIF